MVVKQVPSGVYADTAWPLFRCRVVFVQALRGLYAGASWFDAGAVCLFSENTKVPTVLVVLVVPSSSEWSPRLCLRLHIVVSLFEDYCELGAWYEL